MTLSASGAIRRLAVGATTVQATLIGRTDVRYSVLVRVLQEDAQGAHEAASSRKVVLYDDGTMHSLFDQALAIPYAWLA